MNIFIFIMFFYFMASLAIALIRFVTDVFRYPVFCKVLKKNIKMFKRYQKQYKDLLRDLEKEKAEVSKLRKQFEKKEGEIIEHS